MLDQKQMAWLVIGFVSGVFLLQQQATLPELSLFVPVALLAAIIYWLVRRSSMHQWIQATVLMLIGSSLGFFYAGTFATIRMHDALPHHWQQKNIEIIGVVASMPQIDDKGVSFQFDIEQTLTVGAIVPDHISLNSYHAHAWRASSAAPAEPSPQARFEAGQRWRMTVRLKRPHTTYNPYGYDYEAWSFANNIRATGSVRQKLGMQKLDNFVWKPRYMVEYCRSVVASNIQKVLTNTPYGGVVRALVVGDSSQIQPNDWQTYLNTGTNHLMSISGLHISMLAGLAFSLTTCFWRRMPKLVAMMPTRRAAIMAGIVAAGLYACLAGLSIPTQRTLYMLIVFGVVLLWNKVINRSRVLLLAMLVVVLLDPWAVIAPGFWLSFSAVAVIAYATAYRLRLQHWLIEATKTQLAVTIGLIPFLVLMFGQTSVISPVANAIAIPVISLLVVPLAILGALMPIDAPLILAQQILEWLMLCMNWLASLPFANWYQALPPIWTFFVAMLGILWCLLPRGWPMRWLGLMLLLPMLLYQPAQLSNGDMRMTVLDVGQGLAVVIQTANHAMVYDTGQRYSEYADVGNRIVLPYLRANGINTLNHLVISHDDIDHNGGAASLIHHIAIDQVSSSYTLPNRLQKRVRHQLCQAGQAWEWDNVKFQVLYPDAHSYLDATLSDNNRSCVIKVSSQYGSVLLTGDIEEEVETLLTKQEKQSIKSDVLIAPHHGSLSSSTENFVRLNNAQHVIFTSGYLNRFKHPRPAVLSRYLLNHASLYRTDLDGALVIDFNQADRLRIRRWRMQQPKYWHN